MTTQTSAGTEQRAAAHGVTSAREGGNPPLPLTPGTTLDRKRDLTYSVPYLNDLRGLEEESDEAGEVLAQCLAHGTRSLLGGCPRLFGDGFAGAGALCILASPTSVAFRG